MDDENKKDILPSSQRGRKRKSSAASNPHDSKRARKGSEFLRKIDVAVEEILSREMNDPPSLKNYMELYSDVYGNLVEGNIRERRRLSGSGESSQSSGSGCTAAEIYKRLDLILNKKLRSFVQDAKNLVGYDLLGYYTKQFSLYKSHVNFLDGIFGYMNRAWVKSINTSALQPKETIYSFCMTQWRTKVFNELNTKVAQALLNLIEEKRSAMEDKNGVIKTVIDSYIIMCEPTIGSKSTKAVEISLEIYTVNFEEPFLEKSKHFYSNVASEWISSKCIQNYVKDTDDYLKGEEARGMELFHPSTVVKLVGAMLDAFVRDRAAILLEAMPSLLASNDIGSLKYLLGHLLRLESFSMDEVIATFKLNVVAAGQDPGRKVESGRCRYLSLGRQSAMSVGAPSAHVQCRANIGPPTTLFAH